jgi:tetratricopeptide (TPR) repeat protein
LGDRFRQSGRLDAALIEYEKALKDEPDNALILLKAAKTHLALGQKDAAIENLRRATAMNPNYGTPHIELALLVEGKEAEEHLQEAIAINPFDPRIKQRQSELNH